MNHKQLIVLFSCVFLITIFSAGCGSTPHSRFYSLNSLSTGKTVKSERDRDNKIIAVGPIRIPEYLDRPQIVTRSGQNELMLAEFQRWGGSLDNDLKRVIPENIAQRLGPAEYLVMNWPVPGEGNVPLQYRVPIDILRFEGMPGDSVTLTYQWGIIGMDNKERMAVHTATLIEPVKGRGYEELVAAMSRAVIRMSVKIADTIRSLPSASAK